MRIEKLLKRIRICKQDKKDAERYRLLRTKHWSDKGIAIVEEAKNVKLGCMTLSMEHLDAILDAELNEK